MLNYTNDMEWKGDVLMENENLNIARSVVDLAVKQGSEMAESYLSYSKELDIEVRGGKVDTMVMAEDRGLGLRVFIGGRTGFAFTTDLTEAGLAECVRQAKDNSAQIAADAHNGLPEKVEKYEQMDTFDPDIAAIPVEDKIALAVAMEKSARDYDPRVKIIESSSYSDSISSVVIANSHGLAASCQSTYCGIYLALVAVDGDDSQTGFAMDYRLKYKDLNPKAIGREAALKAVRMLGAQPVSTRKVSVVLEPYVAAGFLGLMSSSFTAEAVQKGRSLFANKIGSKVASELINVVDDGSLPGGIASAPFDGEGVPTAKTVLIKSGELKAYLYNTYTAKQDGVVSTGNGVRGSFKGTPEVGTTNFYIEPGNCSPGDLVKAVNSGLFVTEVMGMHTANPISGDFSVGVSGLLIENGQITKPVRGVAIAGNIITLLSSVNGVGSDLKFFGGKGAPTLRIEGITVSGH
ncbi:peptidase U62 modulator of DNA gyrase [Desulfofarcimen acetoxidans DSM 771]|uniref:Peptidase U62 modulator of DNA gyrase n=2 Tax=Desulfofarcimen acetoxidans TaxID=58138 RepID=C8W179_DESAS|nr:peptidase U62 modulator of DNA gyrase [Desulfofarcimen acetoxidans DSM 771]